MGLQPQTGTPFAVEITPFLSPLGFPCQAPPSGYVAAVDLRTMKKVWMHKNGTTKGSAPVPVPLPLGDQEQRAGVADPRKCRWRRCRSLPYRQVRPLRIK